MELTQNDANQVVTYYYFGNDAGYSNSDFVTPASLNLAWNNSCLFTSTNCNSLPTSDQFNEEILPGLEVQVFPNPFSDETTLLMDEAPESPYAFHLYNVEGRLLRFETGLMGERYILKRDNLSAGMYFFELHSQGTVLGRGKVVIE